MWLRLDDMFLSGRKVRRVGPRAAMLYLSSLLYSARHLTDGLIERTDLPDIAHDAWIPPKDVAPLVNRLIEPYPETGHPLWEPVGGDSWHIHDWSDYNPSARQYRDKQEHISRVRADAGRRGGSKPRANRQANPEETPEQTGDQTPEHVISTALSTCQAPNPVRSFHSRSPVPDPPSPVPGSDRSHQGDETNEVTVVLQILNTEAHDIAVRTVQRTVERFPDTHPIDVALEHMRYRLRVGDQRRDALSGWALAMKSAHTKGFYGRAEAEEQPAAYDVIPSGSAAWDEIAREILATLGPGPYTTFFAPLRAQEQGHELRLTADPYTREWIERRFPHVIPNAIDAISSPYIITWTTEETA